MEDAAAPLEVEAQGGAPKRSPLATCGKICCGFVAFVVICGILFLSTTWIDGPIAFIFGIFQARLFTTVVAGTDAQWEQWMEVMADDALHVFLVGTGSPVPDAMRSGPCTVVMGGGRFLVFDSGAGAVNKMGVYGLPTGNFSAVFYTHYHSDHIADIGDIITVSWINGRDQPLDIHGPPGIQTIIDNYNVIYQFDQQYRTEHHTEQYMPSYAQHGNPVEFDNPPEGGDGRVVYDVDGMRVTAFNINHRPIYPAVGYKVEYQGRSVIISGDGKSGEEMSKQLQDSDIQVRNVLNEPWCKSLRDAMWEVGDPRNYRLGFLLNDTLDYHTYPVDVIRDTCDFNVKMGVMSHIVPAPPNWFLLRMLQAQNPIPRGCGAEIVWGEDGMHFRLPANGTTIERVETRGNPFLR